MAWNMRAYSKFKMYPNNRLIAATLLAQRWLMSIALASDDKTNNQTRLFFFISSIDLRKFQNSSFLLNLQVLCSLIRIYYSIHRDPVFY